MLNPEDDMIKTRDIEELLKLCILSSYIDGERPVSAMLLSSIEAGKTEILKQFDNVPGVLWANDLTAYGIIANHLENIQNGKVRTMICPDFITPISRSKDTVSTLLAFLNGLIEDGIVSSFTYATNVKLAEAVRINMLTAIPANILNDHRHRWVHTGFLSRVLPVSFSYSQATTLEIREAIGSEHAQPVPVTQSLLVPHENIKVELTPLIGASFAYIVPELLSKMLSDEDEKPYGFRLQHQLQTLCKAHALYEGRERCLPCDFEYIVYLSRYVNLRYTRI